MYLPKIIEYTKLNVSRPRWSTAGSPKRSMGRIIGIKSLSVSPVYAAHELTISNHAAAVFILIFHYKHNLIVTKSQNSEPFCWKMIYSKELNCVND